MLPLTNTTLTGTHITDVGFNRNGVAYVNGTSQGVFLWCATARALQAGNNSNNRQDLSDRTSTVCYMRGLSENIRIQTSSPQPWLWRRICFQTKNNAFQSRATGDGPIPNPWTAYADIATNNKGMARYWYNQALTSPNTIAAQQDFIFRGTADRDWNDPITAPIDTNRIKVVFDRTRTIRSNNDSGAMIERKMWHPMNANLYYGDDEVGAGMSTSYFTADNIRGMGDFFVYDILAPQLGATASDLITIGGTTTIYWHEK